MIGLRSIVATTRFRGAVAGVPDYPLAANASGRALRSPKTAFMRSESVSFRLSNTRRQITEQASLSRAGFGNAHSSATRANNGIPMGAWLTRERSELRSVRINYGEGVIYNLGTMPLPSRSHPTSYHVRIDGDRVLLDHPKPAEADVPHRPDVLVLGEPPTSC
jgi:hypothetical protein